MQGAPFIQMHTHNITQIMHVNINAVFKYDASKVEIYKYKNINYKNIYNN